MAGETFGQRIRRLRKTRKLTQRELADRVAAGLHQEGRGFDVTYLSKIENGHLVPSVAALVAIAEELGDDADELLTLAEKAPPDAGLTASEGQGGPAWDVALERTRMRAKTTGSPASPRPSPPSRI